MQKGFTLVELAVVMTIIGLLVSGILKGQQMIENARITSTIAQIKGYDAAVGTFRDSYSAFPGDMPSASSRLPGCNANCDPVAANAGNFIVGSQTWGSTLNFVYQLPGAGMQNPPSTEGDETELFWIHLLKANLITGVSDDGINAVTRAAWGVTHPAAKIAGGFVVGYGDGTVAPNSPQPAGTGIAGTILVLSTFPHLRPTAGNSGTMPMTPSQAAQIDRKIDDGAPAAGFVQAYGVQTSCFSTASGGYTYNEGVTSKDCGLVIRIQN